MSVNPAPWPARAALVDRWRALPEERRGVALVLLLAGLVFLPRLGSVGSGTRGSPITPRWRGR